MKKLSLLFSMVMVSAVVVLASGPPYNAGADVLGAHNGYGRGCVMCHAPHSGSLGNGKTTSSDPYNGMYALWGQDLAPLYGNTYSFSGDGKSTYSVTLPSNLNSGVHDANTIILLCLSCHDGVSTTVGMMQGQTVETLPIVGGTAPTKLAAAKPSGGASYQNDHPVGVAATVGCGGAYNWDCNGGTGTTQIWMNGPNSAQFLINYPGSFWNNWNSAYGSYAAAAGQDASVVGNLGCTSSSGSATACAKNPLAKFTGTVNAVGCTTCHDQHSMTQYTNSNGSFATMFFIRGNYTPNTNGNSVAQFCRNCHGGESNEMNGLAHVPTT